MLEYGQLPENRQISKIVKLCGIDFHVLMEYNTVSLKNKVSTKVSTTLFFDAIIRVQTSIE